MAYNVTGVSGNTLARELLVAYLNTGTAAAPVWSILGKRVEESSEEFDWQTESKKDIIGNTFNTMKKPIISQEFTPCQLDSGETALTKIWEIAVRDQDNQALANQDMLIVHCYTTDGETNPKFFAERYAACMVEVSSIGGPGGGDLEMPLKVTYGGTRTVGGATIAGGVVTFTED